jgi:hypothetical protein
MPSLSDHKGSQYVKLAYIGDSGTGKTGSLTSLVAAGYSLHILDLDNGLDALVQHVRKECPDNLRLVDYETKRDKYVMQQQGPVCLRPTAFVEGTKLLHKWPSIDLNKAGPEHVLVIDSGTSLGKAAFEWARGMNPTAKDPRQWYFQAQQAFENIIAFATSEEFECNFILISHINYRELQDGTTKGYTSAVGSALGPTISKYFNTLLMADTKGSGTNVRRTIRTVPTPIVDLKNPAPFSLAAELPLETGLASIFEKLRITTAKD